MTTILLGILSSVFAEIVVSLNKKLKGTVLQGDAAFLLAFGMAIVASVFTQATTNGISVSTFTNTSALIQTFTSIFTISQLYFLFIVRKLRVSVPTQSLGMTLSNPTSTDPINKV